MKNFADFAVHLRSDRSGNVLPIAAVAMLVGIAIVGGGVDMSRAYKAKNRMQAACDSATLAGRKAVTINGFDTDAENTANDYFGTNFDENSQEVRNVVFNATSDDNGNTVVGKATAVQDTALMRVFGFNEFDLEVDCSASMGVGNSDVVMVLDSTGSMGWNLPGSYQTRISALRAAMKNFYDTLSDATSGTNARIRYGFVPYSQSVNVGHLLEADWLVDEYEYASRRPDYDTQTTEVFDYWGDPVYSTDTSKNNNSSGSWSQYSSTPYGDKNQCIQQLPSDGSWEDHGNSTTETTSQEVDGQLIEITSEIQPQRKLQYRCRKSSGIFYINSRYKYRDFITSTTATSDAVYTTEETEVFDRWIYENVIHDTSDYKTFSPASALVGASKRHSDNDYGDMFSWTGDPVTSTSLWQGCILERKTVASSSFSFTSLLGLSPSGALDLDIDSAPDISDPETQWAPMWPEVSYRRWDNSGDHYTQDSTTNGTSARSNARCPTQSRLLSEMDETSFDNYADSLVATGNTYLDVGMVWGGRLSSPTGIFQSNVAEEPNNGAEVARHLIFMTDGEMATVNDRPTAYGIERNEHRVTDNGWSNQNSRHLSRFSAACQVIKAKGIRIWVIAFGTGLSSHLQACASDSSAFQANDADQLNGAFQEIAKQVGELRIIQ